MRENIWNNYVFGKQSINQLSEQYKRSEKWIRNQLELVDPLLDNKILPQPITLVADTTFFGRSYGVLVFREPHLKRSLYFKEVTSETPLEYAEGRYTLEKQGFTFKSVTTDGKRGVREVFRGILAQMCQFHQIAIVNRYLTRRPKLEPAIELRRITLSLTKTDEESFTKQLAGWHMKYHPFLKEKTINPMTGRWFYTHKRIRSAYRSLITNLPYLFTYQRYPELEIPNTTNSLDGYFSNLKTLLRIHRGLTKKRRFKVIQEILNS